MPWRGVIVSEQRQRFLEDYKLNYYTVTDLAERFSISRKTAHKWINRYREHGQSGFHERSRCPDSCPWQTDAAIVEELVALRRAHPHWGPRKLLDLMQRRTPNPTQSKISNHLGVPDPAAAVLVLSSGPSPAADGDAHSRSQIDAGGGLPTFPMTRFRNQLSRFKPHAGVVVDILLIGLASYVAISHLLSDLSLSPDSSSYITAAKNFAQTGRLVVFVNSPSQDMRPKVELYTEQPPGLPAYFVPFMLVFDGPIRSAVIAQAAVIACLFTFLYLLMGRLGLSRPLRAIALGTLLMMDGFRYIYIDPGTEALFICLSVIIGWLAVRYYQGGQERWVWPILVLLIAFSTSVRYIGVANVAWLIPALFRRRTIAGIPQLTTHRYVVMVIIGGGLALVVLSLLADALGLSKNPGIGPVQTWGIAVGLVTFMIGMILLGIGRRLKLHAGAERSDSALAPDVYWPIGAAFAAVVPVGLWLLRNQLIVGKPTRTGQFDTFMPENLLVPFEFIGSRLFDLRFVPTTIVALVAGVIVLLPLWLSYSSLGAA